MRKPAPRDPAARATIKALAHDLRRAGGPSDRLGVTAAHRRGLARQPQLLAGVGDRGTVDLEDRDVAVGVVADVEMAAVLAEHRPLRQAADVDLARLADLLAVEGQHHDLAG